MQKTIGWLLTNASVEASEEVYWTNERSCAPERFEPSRRKYGKRMIEVYKREALDKDTIV